MCKNESIRLIITYLASVLRANLFLESDAIQIFFPILKHFYRLTETKKLDKPPGTANFRINLTEWLRDSIRQIYTK